MENSLYKWIIDHDDSRAFVFGYIIIAVVLSTFISLFWLLAVVAVHAVFEYIKESQVEQPVGLILKKVLWEIKLDIALILFSFAIHLYLGVIMGVAGLGAAARGGTGVGRSTSGILRTTSNSARAVQCTARLQKSVRAGFMMLDEAVLVLRGIFMRKASGADAREVESDREICNNESCDFIWSLGAKFSVALSLLSLIFLLLAPFITEYNTYGTVIQEILSELNPLG